MPILHSGTCSGCPVCSREMRATLSMDFPTYAKWLESRNPERLRRQRRQEVEPVLPAPSLASRLRQVPPVSAPHGTNAAGVPNPPSLAEHVQRVSNFRKAGMR
jgi:hypothetical protein